MACEFEGIKENKRLTNDRNVGIEIARIVSMLAIVMTHVLSRGMAWRENGFLTYNYFFSHILNAFTYFGVNCFAITTGYLMYGRKRKPARILELWIEVVLYLLISSLLFCVFDSNAFSKTDFLTSFIPIIRGQYWYFTAYAAMAIFVPIFNVIIDKLSFNQMRRLLWVVFVLTLVVRIAEFMHQEWLGFNAGMSLIWLICLYFVGAAIKKHGI